MSCRIVYSPADSAPEAAASDSLVAGAAAFFAGRPRPFFPPPAAAAFFLGLAFFLAGEAAFLATFFAGEAVVFLAGEAVGDFLLLLLPFGRPRPRFASESAWSLRAAEAEAAAFRPDAARLGAAPFAAAAFFGRPRPRPEAGFAGDPLAPASPVAVVAVSAIVLVVVVVGRVREMERIGKAMDRRRKMEVSGKRTGSHSVRVQGLWDQREVCLCARRAKQTHDVLVSCSSRISRSSPSSQSLASCPPAAASDRLTVCHHPLHPNTHTHPLVTNTSSSSDNRTTLSPPGTRIVVSHMSPCRRNSCCHRFSSSSSRASAVILTILSDCTSHWLLMQQMLLHPST